MSVPLHNYSGNITRSDAISCVGEKDCSKYEKLHSFFYISIFFFVFASDFLSAVDCARLLRCSPSVQTCPVEMGRTDRRKHSVGMGEGEGVRVKLHSPVGGE